MSDLRCGNPKCDSRTGKQEACFEITATVYDDRSLAIPLHKMEPRDFECLLCGAKAVPDCEYCKDEPDGEGGSCVCGRELDPKEEDEKSPTDLANERTRDGYAEG